MHTNRTEVHSAGRMMALFYVRDSAHQGRVGNHGMESFKTPTLSLQADGATSVGARERLRSVGAPTAAHDRAVWPR